MLYKKLLLSLFILIFASVSYADTFNVINSDASGTGSLSWAVNSVNSLGGSGHIIEFSPDIKTIIITQELTLNASATINGNGASLEGSGGRRLFTVTSGHAVFNKLTFSKGYAVADNGGAVKVEGTNASAEFNNCTFFNNRADNYGGAVCITNGSVNPRTTLTHCTIAGNNARTGGGFAILNGEAAIYSSIVTGNSTSYDIYADSAASLSARSNVTGASNFALSTGNLSNVDASDVLIINSNGNIQAEEVEGVKVLKLSSQSKARDFVNDIQFTLETDEVGTTRPQLEAYDAGAYEAKPVPIISVDVYGLPYVQVNGRDAYVVEIYPEDASVKSIEWLSNNPSALSVDNNGNASSGSTGEAQVTVNVIGWDENGNLATVPTDKALTVYVGEEKRGELEAEIAPIDDVQIRTGGYEVVKPEVTITVNDYVVEKVRGGVTYELSQVSSSSSDIVSARPISGDSIMLLARDKEGQSRITVTAKPLPSGNSMTTNFNVSVSGNAARSAGRSSGGGGCEAGAFGIAGMILLCVLLINRKE